jgi:hypothetical protein
MLKRLSRLISRKANGRSVLIFLGLQLFFSLWVFPFFTRQFGPGEGQSMLDLMFGFSPEQAYDIISAYGDAGRSGAIITTTIADSIYPFVYAGLLALAISWFHNGIPLKNRKWQYLNLLPFAALIFDFAENAGIIAMLAGYPAQAPVIAHIASAAGMLKWTFVVVSTAALVFVIILGKIRPFFLKNDNTTQN